jgi:hypothetical protein
MKWKEENGRDPFLGLYKDLLGKASMIRWVVHVAHMI